MGCTGKRTKKAEDTVADILSSLNQIQNMPNKSAIDKLKSNYLSQWTELDPECEEWYMHPSYATSATPFVDDKKRKYMINSFNELFI